MKALKPSQKSLNEPEMEPLSKGGSTSVRARKLRGASYAQQREMLSPMANGLAPTDRHLLNHAPQSQNSPEESPSPHRFAAYLTPRASLKEEPRTHQPTFTLAMYEKHQEMAQKAEMNSGVSKWTREFIGTQWANHKARYEGVAKSVDMPAELICAIHLREASGNFNTYLHQGDPLGKPAVNHPANIPVFHKWEDAAIHALKMKHKVSIREDLGMNSGTTDIAAMATFSEYYNGLGYHNRGRSSPYVYAQTSQYEGGKYVADGRYDPNAVDQNPGVIAILAILNNPAFAVDTREVAPRPMGYRVLQSGSTGHDVRELQAALNALGYVLSPDGEFGPGTVGAVKAFQRTHDLTPDGIAGQDFFDTLRDEHVVDASAMASERESETESVDIGAGRSSAEYGLMLDGTFLQLGMTGIKVEYLQRSLKLLGGSVEVDGTYGPATRAVVAWIQRSAGLRADGIAGPETQKEITRRLRHMMAML